MPSVKMEQKQPRRRQDSSVTNAAAVATTIDDLPEHLILHILSFLSTPDAISTSLVSRKWRSLWTKIPSLYFPYSLHFPDSLHDCYDREEYDSNCKFIDRTLILRSPYPLQNFRLEFIYLESSLSEVDSWIRYAVKNRVEEIHLDFMDSSHIYYFPFYILKNGNVRVLKLNNCDLILPSNMSSLNLWRMKSLYLERILLNDKMCEDIIDGCPNLEILELQNCINRVDLKLCSKSLKELKLNDPMPDDTNAYDLEVDCPNLVKLSIVWIHVRNFRARNLYNLVHFGVSVGDLYNGFYEQWCKIVSFLDQMPQIKSLAVQNWGYKFTSKEVFSKDSLHNLKHLELQTRYTQYDLLGMEALLELAPNVETLILDYDEFYYDEDESLSEELSSKRINLSIPNLREVKMKQLYRTEDELKFLSLLMKQEVVLEKIVAVPADPSGEKYVPVVWRKRLRKFEVVQGSSPFPSLETEVEPQA